MRLLFKFYLISKFIVKRASEIIQCVLFVYLGAIIGMLLILNILAALLFYSLKPVYPSREGTLIAFIGIIIPCAASSPMVQLLSLSKFKIVDGVHVKLSLKTNRKMVLIVGNIVGESQRYIFINYPLVLSLFILKMQGFFKPPKNPIQTRKSPSIVVQMINKHPIQQLSSKNGSSWLWSYP